MGYKIDQVYFGGLYTNNIVIVMKTQNIDHASVSLCCGLCVNIDLVYVMVYVWSMSGLCDRPRFWWVSLKLDCVVALFMWLYVSVHILLIYSNINI